jgi:hypothetical protein
MFAHMQQQLDPLKTALESQAEFQRKLTESVCSHATEVLKQAEVVTSTYTPKRSLPLPQVVTRQLPTHNTHP